MEFDDWEQTVDWLVAQRKQKGLSLRDMSVRMQVPTTTVWRLEQKKRCPSYVMATWYIEALGFKIAILEPLPLE